MSGTVDGKTEVRRPLKLTLWWRGGGGGGVRLSRMSYLLNGNSKRGSIGHVDIVWLPYLRHPVVFDSETSRLADRMGD